MKVEEGTIVGGDNRPSAEPTDHLRAYFARKRVIVVRSALVIIPAAVIAASWSAQLGLCLAVGWLCGVVNMLLVMRNNEHLLGGERSRAIYEASNTVRMIVVGLVPVLAASHGPWWFMLASLAGLFLPLTLYSFELRREMSTE